MKAFVALTVANEIDGHNTVVRADKASANRGKLEEWLRSRPPTWREQIRMGSPPQQGFNMGVQPTQQVMDCLCQTNIIEIEVEDI
jgi:hypothetical protein